MDDNTERISDLMAHHKALEQEELFLNALLSKIDKQIHALQVEQLHLLNTKNRPDSNEVNYVDTMISGDIEELSANEPNEEPSTESRQELDLRPIRKYDASEEYEEDEDPEDNQNQEFPDNSADFDYL